MNGRNHNLGPRVTGEMDVGSSTVHDDANSDNEDSLDAGSPLKNLSRSYQLGSIGHVNSKYIALDIDNMPSLQEENNNGYPRQSQDSEQKSVVESTGNNNYSSSFAEYDTVINSPEKKSVSAQEEAHYADGSPHAPALSKSENGGAQWKNFFQPRNRPQLVNGGNMLGSYKHNNEHGAATIENRMNNGGDDQYYSNLLPDVSSHIIKHDASEDEEDSKLGQSNSFNRFTETHDENDKSIFHYEFAEKTNNYTSSFYNEKEINGPDSDISKAQMQSQKNNEEGEQEQEEQEQAGIEEPNNTFLKRKKGISAFNVPQSIPEYHMTNTSDNSNVSGDPAPDARNVFANLFSSNIKPIDNTNNNVQRHYVNADAAPHPTASGLSNATTAIASASSNPAFQQNVGQMKNKGIAPSGHKKALSTTTPQDVGMFYDEKTGVWANPHNSSSMGSANASANTMGDPSLESSRNTVNISGIKARNLNKNGDFKQPSLKTPSTAGVAYNDSLDYEDTSVLPDPIISPLEENLEHDHDSYLNEPETKYKALLTERLIQLAGTTLGSIYDLDISSGMLGLEVQDYFCSLFEMLPNLLELKCSNNGLHEVCLPKFTNLESLNLSENKLKEVNTLLNGVHLHLRSLDLTHNLLTQFETSSAKCAFFKLQNLNLSHNSFSGHFELNLFEDFPNLQTLDVSDNQGLTHISLKRGTKPLRLLLNNNSQLQKVTLVDDELPTDTLIFQTLEMENCLPTLIAYMNTKYQDNIAHMVISSVTPTSLNASWKFARSLESLIVKKYWLQDDWYRLNEGLEQLLITEIISDINCSFPKAGGSLPGNNLKKLHALSIANTNLSFPLSFKFDFLFENLQIKNLHELNVKENVEIKSKIYTQFDIYEQDRVEALYRHGTQKKFGGSLTMLDGRAGFFDWDMQN